MTSARDLLRSGRDAMTRGAWAEARTLLQDSVRAGETAEALEELGLAGWWLDDATLTFESRERAFSLYRTAGDATGAARVAIWLVWDNLAFRGDFAVASGWLERARRLLEDRQTSPEYGWLLIREAEVALFRGHDPAAAIAGASRAAALGRDIGDRSVEFTALALEGLAHVSAGSVALGMRRLDEATVAATSGEVTELHAVGLVCCWQIFACERVRDYDRAAQWCARVQEFSRRWGLHPLSATCRTQYAGILMWRGEWDAAEEELGLATRELERVRPASTAGALARLGELRLRQGRLDEAHQLFEQASSQPIARVGQAELELACGRPDAARAIVDQFLSSVGEREATMRVGALELAVRVHCARRDLASAERVIDELRRIAADLDTKPTEASLLAAEGTILRARGDQAGAVRSLSRAVELFESSGAPFETARARLELAMALGDSGLRDGAAREAADAHKGFAALGAGHDAARAAALVHALSHGASASDVGPLTRRQLEILRLVAQGLSNPQIAQRLRISDHTVKRHVANLLIRLDVKSRAAAAAIATRRGLL